MKKRLATVILEHEGLTAALLILLGALLRLLLIGSVPDGLNQDEASAGYEAWSLLTSGIDRCGDRWPVLFTAWGSGQNVLCSYLAMPFIALLGLSPLSLRLVMGLAGSASLFFMYKLARAARGGGFGLTALAVLALCPWHIMASRWALESNLLPFTLLLGVYFLVRSKNKPPLMLGAGAAFGLSLYAYGTAYIFLPIFLAASSILMAARRELRLRWYLAALAVFAVIALPVSLCNLRNALGLEETKLLWMTLPKLTETRQTATTILSGGEPLAAIFENLKALLRLLWRQRDGLVWNSIPVWGLFWGVPGLTLACGGVITALLERRRSLTDCLMLLWLAAAFAAALLIEVNVNRVNMLFLPIIYFQALGVFELLRPLGRRIVPPAAFISGALCIAFCVSYMTTWRQKAAPAFFDGLGEAIHYAAETDAPVWISGDVNMPYIYVLFYERIPAPEFLDTVEYINPDGAFRQVKRFGRYSFGGKPPADSLCIAETGKASGATLARFGGYTVFSLSD